MLYPALFDINTNNTFTTFSQKEKQEFVTSVQSTLVEDEKYIYNPFFKHELFTKQVQTNLYVKPWKDVSLVHIEDDYSSYSANYDIDVKLPLKKSIKAKVKIGAISKKQFKTILD